MTKYVDNTYIPLDDDTWNLVTDFLGYKYISRTSMSMNCTNNIIGVSTYEEFYRNHPYLISHTIYYIDSTGKLEKYVEYYKNYKIEYRIDFSKNSYYKCKIFSHLANINIRSIEYYDNHKDYINTITYYNNDHSQYIRKEIEYIESKAGYLTMTYFGINSEYDWIKHYGLCNNIYVWIKKYKDGSIDYKYTDTYCQTHDKCYLETILTNNTIRCIKYYKDAEDKCHQKTWYNEKYDDSGNKVHCRELLSNRDDKCICIDHLDTSQPYINTKRVLYYDDRGDNMISQKELKDGSYTQLYITSTNELV